MGEPRQIIDPEIQFYFHRLNVKNITGFENKSYEHKNVPLQAIIYNNEKHSPFLIKRANKHQCNKFRFHITSQRNQSGQ